MMTSERRRNIRIDRKLDGLSEQVERLQEAVSELANVVGVMQVEETENTEEVDATDKAPAKNKAGNKEEANG